MRARAWQRVTRLRVARLLLEPYHFARPCRYFNLCPSALIVDAPHQQLDAREPRVSIERHSIKHNVLVGSGPEGPRYTEEHRTYAFATHIQGVLPRLLERLLDARKLVKRLMAAATDPLQAAVLNGRQLGIKVACNSVYGFCGVAADRGMLPCKPVAAVTTLKGRAFIEVAKNYVEQHFLGARVIYGDTVRAGPLVLVRCHMHVRRSPPCALPTRRRTRL